MRQWAKCVVWGGALLAAASTLSIKVNEPRADAAREALAIVGAVTSERAQPSSLRRARLVRLPDEENEESARAPVPERRLAGVLALLALLGLGRLAVGARRRVAGFSAAAGAV